MLLLDVPKGPNRGRADVASPITEEDIARCPAGPMTIQFSTPLTQDDHARLGEWSSHHGDVHLRAYTHRRSLKNAWATPDLEFLRHYPNITGAVLKGHPGPDQVDPSGLRHLPATLRSLALSFRLPKGWDGAALARLTQLREFSLSDNPTVPPALAHLTQLTELRIEGPLKKLDHLQGLDQVTDLYLRSVTLPSLAPLRELPALSYLDLVLGGTTNLDELPHLAALTRFTAGYVRGLREVRGPFRSPTLHSIILAPQGAITALPDMSHATSLRHLSLHTTGLIDPTALISAPPLALLSMTIHGPDDLTELAPLRALQVDDLRLDLNTKARTMAARDILQLPGSYWGEPYPPPQ